MIAVETKTTKRCTKCRQMKKLDEFNKDKQTKDNLACWCHSCKKKYRRIYYQLHKTKQINYALAWTKANQSKVALYQKDYKQSLKGRIQQRYDNIKTYCTNPHCKEWKNIGKKGIKIKFSFTEFYNFIINTCKLDTVSKLRKMVVDRIDVSIHYTIENLRIVSLAVNTKSRHKCLKYAERAPSSRFRGVSWCKRRKRWIVRLMHNGVTHYLGSFSLEAEGKAALCWDEACEKYHGAFGLTNFQMGLL